MARLEVLLGRKTERMIELDTPALVVGRGEGSQLRLDNELVSRQHCELYKHGEAWAVRDLGSTTGTFVNGNKTEAVRLQDGDTIELGKFTLMFHAHSPAGSVSTLASSASLWDDLVDEVPVSKKSSSADHAESAARLSSDADADPGAWQGTMVADKSQMDRIRAALSNSQVPHLKARIGGKQLSVPMESFPFEVGFFEGAGLQLPGSKWLGKKAFVVTQSGEAFLISAGSFWASVTMEGKKLGKLEKLLDGATIEVGGYKLRFGRGA